MSRAFVNEDAGGDPPPPQYHLPARDHPTFDAAAAAALLEGARVGNTLSAEEATGYAWGERRLRTHVEKLLADAIAQRDDRLEQLATRYLRHGGA